MKLLPDRSPLSRAELLNWSLGIDGQGSEGPWKSNKTVSKRKQ